MFYLGKIAFAEAKQGSAIHFTVAAHVVMNIWLERFSFPIVPVFVGAISTFGHHLMRIPVFLFFRYETASFKDQYFFARAGQFIRYGAAAAACAYDNDIVMIGHEKKLCNKEKESMKLTLSHARQKLYSANINFVKNIFMKKLLIGVVLVLITGITAIAQKSSTFIHSDKAIRGFDPVAYFTEAKPVMGSDSLNLEWNNAILY